MKSSDHTKSQNVKIQSFLTLSPINQCICKHSMHLVWLQPYSLKLYICCETDQAMYDTEKEAHLLFQNHLFNCCLYIYIKLSVTDTTNQFIISKNPFNFLDSFFKITFDNNNNFKKSKYYCKYNQSPTYFCLFVSLSGPILNIWYTKSGITEQNSSSSQELSKQR